MLVALTSIDQVVTRMLQCVFRYDIFIGRVYMLYTVKSIRTRRSLCITVVKTTYKYIYSNLYYKTQNIGAHNLIRGDILIMFFKRIKDKNYNIGK